MKIEELLKDLDPVTIIEFKNYLLDNLSNLCSTKNSNSKIISKYKNEEISCEKCGCKMYKNGTTKSSIQKYICSKCAWEMPHDLEKENHPLMQYIIYLKFRFLWYKKKRCAKMNSLLFYYYKLNKVY